MKTIRVAIAQINTTVGNISGNSERIIDSIKRAKKESVNIITFPELAITGYPPKDLLIKRKFIKENISALDKIRSASSNISVVVGFVNFSKGNIYNSAALIQNKKLSAVQNKIHLPNYDVFDEKRYFTPAEKSIVFSSGTLGIGISICEDIWIKGFPVKNQALAGAQILINISASPYHAGRPAFRRKMLPARCRETKSALVFNNLVGGQDDLVFDGNSMIIGHRGNTLREAKSFCEDFIWADIDFEEIGKSRSTATGKKCSAIIPVSVNFNIKKKKSAANGQQRRAAKKKALSLSLIKTEEIYNALVLGVKDYVRKNGFSKAVLGLSGGIDSSLVAVIARDALGSENVTGIAMPTSISSSHSVEDAEKLAKNLAVNFKIIKIQSVFDEYLKLLSPVFKGLKWGVAEENIQARIRGNLLMALSNKFGCLLLSTGNKSELSVGYATLYGDMAGGLAVISDVPKTLVYRLARYRNRVTGKDIIPRRCITKPPSAELSPDQKDTDSLPEYEVLDRILHLYVEEDRSLEEIVKLGVDRKTAREVILKIDGNEYKRQQAAPGIRITSRAFGSGRRIPITNKYRG